VKCGNDAYIRVAGDSGYDMVCAHCFGARGPGRLNGRKGGDASPKDDKVEPLPRDEKIVPPLNPDPELHRT
jgi:hypothetical protein